MQYGIVDARDVETSRSAKWLDMWSDGESEVQDDAKVTWLGSHIETAALDSKGGKIKSSVLDRLS